MNILLINMALRPESKVKMFPIGFGYIGTAIAGAGYEFDLIDIDAHRFSDDEVDRLIEKKNYDVVCMGCIVTGYKFVKDLCRRIRERHPVAVIVVGNSVATSIPEILLGKTEADVAVMGEGDITIVEILSALERKHSLVDVAGIYFRKNGSIVKNPPRPPIEDVSVLPFMNFGLFDVGVYIENSREYIVDGLPIPRQEVRSLPVNTARGCVAACTFCYHNFRGNPYRYRSAEAIVAEIKDMIGRYGLNLISIFDELTLFSRKRAEDLADAILRSGLRFYWNANCRVDLFTRDSDLDLLLKLREAGLVSLGYSLESSNPEILAAMNKKTTVEQFVKTTELACKAGMRPMTSLVIGFPQETPETIADTFETCRKNRVYPSAGYLLPQPGSVMYDYAKEHGFIVDDEDYLLRMGDRQDLRLNMTGMTDSEMENAVLEGLRACNAALGVGLAEENLVKTQYYRAAKK